MNNRDIIRMKMLKKARESINQKLAGREIHIIKAVNLLTDLDSVNNLLKENASEWKQRKPTGEAIREYQQLEENTQKIEEEKKSLTEFIEKEMASEFPNFSALATPIIGAKLLSSAGSKKRLCFSPSSTIQVLGAEKALFSHIRKNTKSPKHGHIFNHPLMQKLPRSKRGKAARLIAGKLTIALKQDYFGGENTSKQVLNELELEIEKIALEPEKEKKKLSNHDSEKQNKENNSDAKIERKPFKQKNKFKEKKKNFKIKNYRNY